MHLFNYCMMTNLDGMFYTCLECLLENFEGKRNLYYRKVETYFFIFFGGVVGGLGCSIHFTSPRSGN